jgi:CRP-like cAMP-binding protein
MSLFVYAAVVQRLSVVPLSRQFLEGRAPMTDPALDQYRQALGESVVFEGLSPSELDLIMAHCRLVDEPAGHEVLWEGRKGRGLYVILEGSVEVFLPERSGSGLKRPSRVRLNVLGRGRCLGEYGLIDDQPSSASAQTMAVARLCFLPTDDFRDIVKRNDRIGKIVYANLLRFLVSRLRSKDRELDLVMLVDEPRPG